MKIWIFSMKILIFPLKISDFLLKKSMIFFMIFLTSHKISDYKVTVSTWSVEACWLGGSFLMVYRNNTGRLGSGFISVCLETRWLGQKSGFYVLERHCTHINIQAQLCHASS